MNAIPKPQKSYEIIDEVTVTEETFPGVFTTISTHGTFKLK